MGERGREVVHRLIEVFATDEVGKGGRKGREAAVEAGTECEVLQRVW